MPDEQPQEEEIDETSTDESITKPTHASTLKCTAEARQLALGRTASD